MHTDKLKISETTDGKPPRPGFESEVAPAPINPLTGQHESYWVLSKEERAREFVRPVRRSYRHVGLRSKYPLRDLTEDEKTRYAEYHYVKCEDYPASESPVTGRYWTQKDLDNKGCGTTTIMGLALAETYARDPSYYGATFCCNCRTHFPVEQFTWMDEHGNDTQEILGS
jgi:hypothetical protein